MLFYLKKDNKQFYVVDGTTFVIGRSKGDVTFPEDSSISRKHATVSCENGKVYITDDGSKYGTFMCRDDEYVKIASGDRIRLNINEEVRFGLQHNKWRLHGMYLETAQSELTSDGSATLRSLAAPIGMKISDDWSESCTHLTVQNLTPTSKVLCAIMAKTKIVSIEFWKKCYEKVKKNEPLPNSECYELTNILDNITGEQISIEYDTRRKKLFEGKIFVFASEADKRSVRRVIELAGGATETRMSFGKRKLTDPGVVVVRSENNDDTLEEFLARRGLRTIPIHEISSAILYCNDSIHCNPSRNISSALFGEKELARETESPDFETPQADSPALGLHEDVPSTIESFSRKRSRSGDSIQCESEKKKKESKFCNFKEDFLKNLSKKSNKTTEESDEKSLQHKKRKGVEELNPTSRKKKRVSGDPADIDIIDLTRERNDDKTKKVSEWLETQRKSSIADLSQIKIIKASPKRLVASACNLSASITSSDDFVDISGWMSKSISKLNISSRKISEENLAYYESMKDTVIVKPLVDWDRKQNTQKDLIGENGGKNFKKFRKVQPKYSSGIIETSRVVAV